MPNSAASPRRSLPPLGVLSYPACPDVLNTQMYQHEKGYKATSAFFARVAAVILDQRE